MGAEGWLQRHDPFFDRERVFCQEPAFGSIRCSIKDRQRGLLGRKVQGSPNTLMGLCCGNIPLVIEYLDATLGIGGTDEMHTACGQRERSGALEMVRKDPLGSRAMSFGRGLSSQLAVMAAGTIETNKQG